MKTKSIAFLDKIRGPFDFDLSAPSSLPWQRSKDAYRRVIRLSSGKLVLVSVKDIGTIEKPKLEISVESNLEISNKEVKEVTQKVSRIFILDQDLRVFYSLAKEDAVLKQVIHDFYGMRGYTEPTVFETMVICIIEQQLNLGVSKKIRELLIKNFGEKLEINNQIYYAFPSPETLSMANIGQLRKCRLSENKASCIKKISESVIKGDFDPEELEKLSNEEIKKKLMNFKGIGRWTAEYILVRGLGRNVIPADDLALRKAISEFYFNGKKLSEQEIRKFAQRWGNHLGITSFYLLCARRHSKK